MQFQWQQFIVLILALGAPALSWGFGKLREQYEKKRREDAARAREQESLRVQHSAERLEQPSPQTAAQRRIEELAQRRQAQLEELRKRRAGAEARQAPPRPHPVVLTPTSQMPQAPQQGPMRPGVPGMPMRIPAPGTPKPGMPQTPAQSPRPAARHSAQPHPLPHGQGRTRPAGRPSPMRPVAPERVAPVEQIARAPVAKPSAPVSFVRPVSAPSTPGAIARAMLTGGRADPTVSAAAAVALSEILSKPVSMRHNPFDDRM